MPARSRDSAIDALRTLAIWLMAASHVARTVKKKVRPDWFEPVVLLDPMTQGLFMGLVGVSLALSLESSRAKGTPDGQWHRHHLRRAAEIYAISAGLFFLDHGLQWPWSLVGTGILADIALAIVLFAPLMRAARPLLGALLATFLLTGLLAGLEATGSAWMVVNAGNAPLLPNLCLTGFGAVCGLALVRRDRRLGGAILGLAALAAAVSLWLAPFAALLDEPLGRTESTVIYQGASNGLQNTWDLLRGAPLEPKDADYFNPSLAGQPMVWALLVGLWAACAAARPLLDRVHDTLLSLGRFSLGVYVFHLLLVTIPVLVTGRSRPFTVGWHGTAMFGAVMVGCYAYAAVRSWQVRRRRE